MQPEYWWNIYGPFEPGAENAPCMGQVISHYAKLNGMKAKEIARRLTELGWKVGERRMEQILSNNNNDEPEQVSRRRMLARLLAIPPILLGLSAVGDPSLGTTDSKMQSSIDKAALLRYESTLETYWDNFYSSSIQKHKDNIFQWCQHLQQVAEHEHRNHTEILTLLCRFDQLAAITARDQFDYPKALYYHEESVNLAWEIKNAELIAASLVR